MTVKTTKKKRNRRNIAEEKQKARHLKAFYL